VSGSVTVKITITLQAETVSVKLKLSPYILQKLIAITSELFAAERKGLSFLKRQNEVKDKVELTNMTFHGISAKAAWRRILSVTRSHVLPTFPFGFLSCILSIICFPLWNI